MRTMLFVFAILAVGIRPALGQTRTIAFENDQAGQPPRGFSFGLTAQIGKPGRWIVTTDPSAPQGSKVLAQMDADGAGRRFPLAIVDDISLKDVELRVKFKPVSGSEDQAGGLVWRYKDEDNYYLVRANALEGNVVAYKVQNGKRTDLPVKGAGRTYGKKVPVPSGTWSELGVNVSGSTMRVFFNGHPLYEVEDTTFPDAGKVGLWTKADSVTYFDALTIISKPGR